MFWLVFKSSNYYILIGIILSTPFTEKLIYNMLPKNQSKKRTSSKKKSNDAPNRLRPDNVILTLSLEELSWREFERLCFLYYKAIGCNPRETSEGADGGVDLIIYNRKHKTDEAIQIKHYIDSGNQITVKEIRELNSSKRIHGCILAQFITSAGYTNAASSQADKFKIECHDINWVKSKIVKWQYEEKLKKQIKANIR